MAPTRALLTRCDELSMRLGEETSIEEMERGLDDQAKLLDSIDAAGAWELDSRLEGDRSVWQEFSDASGDASTEVSACGGRPPRPRYRPLLRDR